MSLRTWALRRASMLMARRRPDMTITGPEGVYLRRWHVIPRNRLLNVYVHEFLAPDPGEHLHDHPWWSVSWVLSGGYIEAVFARFSPFTLRPISEGDVVFRRASERHHVAYITPRASARTVTVFFTGPVIRKWGFWVDGRFIPHDEYQPGEGIRVEDVADRGA